MVWLMKNVYFETMDSLPTYLQKNIIIQVVFLAAILSGHVVAATPPTNVGHDIRLQHINIAPEGIRADVDCALQDARGFLWLGTSHGLKRYDGSVFVTYRHYAEDTNSLASDQVTSFCEDHRGRIWVATAGGGLNLFDGSAGTMKLYVKNRQDDGATILSMYVDRTGVLWCGRASGLTRFDPATSAFMPLDDKALLYEPIVSIVEDFEGELWIATRGRGVVRIGRDRKTTAWYRYYRANGSGLSSDSVRGLLVGRDGDLWLCTTDKGLCRFDQEKNDFVRYLSNDTIHAFAEDHLGNLWLGLSHWLKKLNPAKGLIANYSYLSAHQSEVQEPAVLFEDRSGLIWISLLDGGIDKVVFNQQPAVPAQFIPPVVITDFMTFDNSNKNFAMGRENFDSIEISYKVNLFALAFSALDYREPSKNQYSIMLEGYDKDWIDIQHNHFARYSDIPPGSYVFRVKASGVDGVWNEAGASTHIIITPPFWKTPAFYTAEILGFIGLMLLGNRYRVGRKLERLSELERVRALENKRVRQRAAEDFHDEFGHKLTKISLLSQVMKRSLANGQREHIEQLNKIIQTSEELSIGMRDFLWTLNPEKDSAEDIAIRLKDFGDGLFNGSGIAFRVSGTENGAKHTPLSVDWRRHLLLIFKEAMNNAAKHAGCGNVTLEFRQEKGTLILRLTDDGKGFNPNMPAAGQGLAGMKKRAEKIHGTLTIDSSSGNGTCVEFLGEIPVAGNGPTNGREKT